jgi:hypothetical protein
MLALVVAGCGHEVSYSAPVGISLNAKSGDVAAGQLVDEKNINTESGNPYGAYIQAARTQLSGKDPSRITLDSLTLELKPSSTNVAGLEDIYTGLVNIDFVMNSSNATSPAGHQSNPKGASPVVFIVDFDFAQLTPADRVDFIGGSFKVVLRGTAASSFATASANADMQATFKFTAYE